MALGDGGTSNRPGPCTAPSPSPCATRWPRASEYRRVIRCRDTGPRPQCRCPQSMQANTEGGDRPPCARAPAIPTTGFTGRGHCDWLSGAAALAAKPVRARDRLAPGASGLPGTRSTRSVTYPRILKLAEHPVGAVHVQAQQVLDPVVGRRHLAGRDPSAPATTTPRSPPRRCQSPASRPRGHPRAAVTRQKLLRLRTARGPTSTSSPPATTASGRKAQSWTRRSSANASADPGKATTR